MIAKQKRENKKFMDYYELAAEKKGYCRFKREVGNTEVHFHGALEFLFVCKGSIEANVGGEKRVLTEGQAYFADSFCTHSYDVADGDGFVVLGDREYFKSFFCSRENKRFPKFFEFNDFSLLEWLCCLCASPRSELNEQMVFSGAIKILLGCLAEKVPLIGESENKQTVFVADVLRFIQKNPDEDLSLKAMSTRFGYSEDHFSRIMRKYLGESWNTYVNRMRARYVDELLKTEPQSSKNILEIVYECGFGSPSSFYRAYKREFGVLPRRK